MVEANQETSWRQDYTIPRSIDFPKGMLGPEERRALFWYAREIVDGRGQVVDAGAFTGTSAYSLACGLAHSRHLNATQVKVHSYDMFEAFEEYTANWIARDFGGHDGSHFEDIFQYQLGQFLDRVVIHKGDILQEKWNGDPVEILFLDLTKTPELNSHIVSEFFPSLIEGHSLVMQQDYFLVRHPFIHATMEFLSENFRLVDSHVKWCTRIWRLESSINKEKIERIKYMKFSHSEIEQLLLSAQAKESDGMSQLFDLLYVQNDIHAGNYESARERISRFVPKGDNDQIKLLNDEHDYLLSILNA